MKAKEQRIKTTNAPSFTKTPTGSKQPEIDDCDFMDDMIDQFVEVSSVPVMPFTQQPLRQAQGFKNINITTNTNGEQTKKRNKVGKKVEKVKKCIEAQSNQNQNKQNMKQDHTKPSTTKQQVKPQHSYSTSNSNINIKLSSANLGQQASKKQKKLKELRQYLQNQQMKECTFKPNSTIKDNRGKDKEKEKDRSKTPKRNVQQFWKSQIQYVEKVQKKRETIKQINEQMSRKQESFRPKINKPLIEKTDERKKKPAFERLYEIKENKSVKNMSIEMEKSINQKKNKQTVGKKRYNQPNLLYEDAQRRQKLAKSIEKNKNNENYEWISSKNKNNEKYNAQKFIKEYCSVLEQLKFLPNKSLTNSNFQYNSIEEDILSDRKFTFEQYSLILKTIGFLNHGNHENSEPAYKERTIAFEGYQILDQYEVNIRNLCIFLLAVLGIFNINPVNFYESHEQNRQYQEFQLNQKQGRKIQKHFDLLYRNYLYSQSKRGNRAKESQNPTVLSSKYISQQHNEYTKQLALKYRSKMIQRANERFIQNNIDIVLPKQQMLTHEDLLVIDNLGRNLGIKKIREDKQNYIDEECTFHPKINKTNAQCLTDRGTERSKVLYQNARNRNQIQKNGEHIKNHEFSIYTEMDQSNKIHYSNNQYCLEKKQIKNKNANPNATNCATGISRSPSPIPSVNNAKIQKQKESHNAFNVKDADKAVARMTIGRMQRQAKSKFLERGQISYRKKDSSKSPLSSKIQKEKQSQNISQMQFNHLTERNLTTPHTERLAIEFDCKQKQQEWDQNYREGQPFLLIDVNMGEEVGCIQLYQGDEKRLGPIVDEFCMDHDLDEQCKVQLIQLVQIEMEKYLNSIGESTQY